MCVHYLYLIVVDINQHLGSLLWVGNILNRRFEVDRGGCY